MITSGVGLGGQDKCHGCSKGLSLEDSALYPAETDLPVLCALCVERIDEDPDVTPRDMVICVPCDTGVACGDIRLRDESGKPVVCALSCYCDTRKMKRITHSSTVQLN